VPISHTCNEHEILQGSHSSRVHLVPSSPLVRALSGRLSLRSDGIRSIKFRVCLTSRSWRLGRLRVKTVGRERRDCQSRANFGWWGGWWVAELGLTSVLIKVAEAFV
jgi:hypothetical protein